MADPKGAIYAPKPGFYQYIGEKPPAPARVDPPKPNPPPPGLSFERAFLAALGEKLYSLGGLIKYFREHVLDKTMRQMEPLTGIAYAEFSRFEKNRKLPSEADMLRLERAFGKEFSQALAMLPEVKRTLVKAGLLAGEGSTPTQK